MPTLHLAPPYRASARDPRPSFAVRQSVNSQRKHGRADPELSAVVANCGVIEDEVEDPEPPKKVAKNEINRNFFNGLTKTGAIEIRRTFFFFFSNC